MEAYGGLGRDDAVDGGRESDLLLGRWVVDECDGDGVAVLHELVGELHHREEVADGEARVEHHGLLHLGFNLLAS